MQVNIGGSTVHWSHWEMLESTYQPGSFGVPPMRLSPSCSSLSRKVYRFSLRIFKFYAPLWDQLKSRFLTIPIFIHLSLELPQHLKCVPHDAAWSHAVSAAVTAVRTVNASSLQAGLEIVPQHEGCSLGFVCILCSHHNVAPVTATRWLSITV